MTKRERLLSCIRLATLEGDTRQALRIHVENRSIGAASYARAVQDGRGLRRQLLASQLGYRALSGAYADPATPWPRGTWTEVADTILANTSPAAQDVCKALLGYRLNP